MREDEYEKLNKSLGTKSEGNLVISKGYFYKVSRLTLDFSTLTASQYKLKQRNGKQVFDGINMLHRHG